MKKVLSTTKAVVKLSITTVVIIFLFFYIISAPLSYGMPYHNTTVYDGMTFEGSMVLHHDGTMRNLNSNLVEELSSLYYYKDGHVFFLEAETQAEYDNEVAEINANFEAAVNTPFYSAKIDLFNIVLSDTGFAITYSCTSAIVFIVSYCVLMVGLVALTVVSFILRRKAICGEL
jgi:hypothetical protein